MGTMCIKHATISKEIEDIMDTRCLITLLSKTHRYVMVPKDVIIYLNMEHETCGGSDVSIPKTAIKFLQKA